MKKNFKNKAEEMAYLLAPREIERKTGNDGKTYRIFDDGNFKTFHLFTIEISLGKHDGTECQRCLQTGKMFQTNLRHYEVQMLQGLYCKTNFDLRTLLQRNVLR